jgi:hypothetical protein
MFKIGDIVVKIITTVTSSRHGGKKGDVWEINKLTKFTKNSAYYQDGLSHSSKVRKATNNEIKWFEAGITNINQIPEVGGTYLNVDNDLRTITGFDYISTGWITTKEFGGNSHLFSTFITRFSNSYKPPIKPTVDRDIMFSKPFEIGDLKKCKIGNLTPEDHKIIQTFLFSLGYKWISGPTKVQYTEAFGLGVSINNKVFKMPDEKDFFSKVNTPIKKETILNYIKLNTNNNYEQVNKRTKIKPESSTIRGASIRIPVITGRIASASRLIGNKASGKCVKSQIRKFEIVANIITC